MIPSHSQPNKQSTPSLFSLIAAAGGALVVLNIVGVIGLSIFPASQAPPPHLVSVAMMESEPTPKQTPSDDGIQECIVTLLSGRRITGELIRKDSLIVVIGINGINTTFQRDRVASILVLPPVAERFAQMRSAITDNDVDARLTLVEWLRIRKAYPLAIQELESVLIDFPSNHRAKLLLTWLTEYNKLGPGKVSTDAPKISKDATKRRSGTSRKTLRNEIKPLTPEQINLMRVYEIDLRNPPKLKVPNETLLTLMRRKPKEFSPNEEDRKALLKISEIDKLKLLFTHKARDLYSQVVVLEDPASMKQFKEDVHSRRGWLINTCASTRCHGGTQAGKFQLINTRLNSNETAYTNFSILEQYTLADGASLIDYEDPQRSPLLQMAMIQKNSLRPHPEIPRDFPGTGFRPIFKSTRDRNYREAIEWIKSMYQPRPVYDFAPTIQPEPKPNQTAP